MFQGNPASLGMAQILHLLMLPSGDVRHEDGRGLEPGAQIGHSHQECVGSFGWKLYQQREACLARTQYRSERPSNHILLIGPSFDQERGGAAGLKASYLI